MLLFGDRKIVFNYLTHVNSALCINTIHNIRCDICVFINFQKTIYLIDINI